MNIYIWIYIYEYINIWIYIYMNIYIYEYIYIYIWIYIYIYEYIYIWIYIYVLIFRLTVQPNSAGALCYISYIHTWSHIPLLLPGGSWLSWCNLSFCPSRLLERDEIRILAGWKHETTRLYYSTSWFSWCLHVPPLGLQQNQKESWNKQFLYSSCLFQVFRHMCKGFRADLQKARPVRSLHHFRDVVLHIVAWCCMQQGASIACSRKSWCSSSTDALCRWSVGQHLWRTLQPSAR